MKNVLDPLKLGFSRYLYRIHFVMIPGCQFASDNTSGISPQALEAIQQANHDYLSSYGEDRLTRQACDRMREVFEHDCDVYFVFTGTAANSLALASLCRSYHSVIAHQTSHIETDECGAPEFFSNGSKILLADGPQGKVSLQEVDRLTHQRKDLHYPKPRVLSLSQSTECGTVYSVDEIHALCTQVKAANMHVHMDGARFGNAISHLKVTPAELTWKAGVDVLCFGGTKLGMAMTEAVIFFDRKLSEDFSWRCKQAGQLNSKMRFCSSQWLHMLKEDAWLNNTAHANAMAQRLAAGFQRIEGVEQLYPVQANAVFTHLPAHIDHRLKERGWKYYNFIGGGARFMCSWRTTEAEVDALLADAID